MLAQRLPGTTIMSVGHRSTLAGLHQRHLEMTPEAIASRCAMPPKPLQPSDSGIWAQSLRQVGPESDT